MSELSLKHHQTMIQDISSVCQTLTGFILCSVSAVCCGGLCAEVNECVNVGYRLTFGNGIKLFIRVSKLVSIFKTYKNSSYQDLIKGYLGVCLQVSGSKGVVLANHKGINVAGRHAVWMTGGTRFILELELKLLFCQVKIRHQCRDFLHNDMSLQKER